MLIGNLKLNSGNGIVRLHTELEVGMLDEVIDQFVRDCGKTVDWIVDYLSFIHKVKNIFYFATVRYIQYSVKEDLLYS